MTAPYCVAVDVGTSRIVAATARLSPEGDAHVAPFRLGRSSDAAASAAFVTEGELVFGDAAERRGLMNPGRLLRGFVRRIGDDVPFIVGDRRLHAEDLFARAVAWAVEAVTEREGAPPAAVAVTAPATWGRYRIELVEGALAREHWPIVETMSVAEAAARHYEVTHPLPARHAIAVYDLGGGTFDAMVIRRSDDDGLEIMGDATGLVDFGGLSVDDAVFHHVLAAAGIETHRAGDATLMALRALRRECVDAKESLSFDSETAIPVLVGDHPTSVRLTRGEFEAMIEDGIERTIDTFTQALEGTGLHAEDIDAIVLIGGSSRIPRIAQVLSERFDRPIALDVDPKAAAVLGAARWVAETRLRDVEARADAAASADGASVGIAAEAAPTPASRRRWFRRVPDSAFVSGSALVFAGALVVTTASALGIPAALDGARTDASAAPLGAGARSAVLGPAERGGYSAVVRVGAESDRAASESSRDTSARRWRDDRGSLVLPGFAPSREAAPPRSSDADPETPPSAGPLGSLPAGEGAGAAPPPGGGSEAAPDATPPTPGAPGPTPPPASQPDPTPGSASDPEPQPDPVREPDAVPEPAPEPDPVPEPVPDPSPAAIEPVPAPSDPPHVEPAPATPDSSTPTPADGPPVDLQTVPV